MISAMYKESAFFFLAGLRYLSSISRWLWIAFLLFGLWLEMFGFLEGTHHLLKLPICTGNVKFYLPNASNNNNPLKKKASNNNLLNLLCVKLVNYNICTICI